MSYLCVHRAVRGVVGDGDAYCPEVAGLCGVGSPLCDFRLLCCVDHLHPAGYGGTLGFPARTPSTLVRIGREEKTKGENVLQR